MPFGPRSGWAVACEQRVDAVIDMVRVCTSNELKRPTAFECHQGAMVTGVSSKGTRVRVKK